MRALCLTITLLAACGADDTGDDTGDAPEECGPLMYYDFADDQCGEGSASGACTRRPDSCSGEVDPVCGCDGVEYTNACQAAAIGIDVDERGGC
jgi:hypothetical protein